MNKKLNTSSASGKPFQPQSSKSTGLTQRTMATSQTLLPTPSTRDWKGASKVKPRDTLDSAVENGATKHKTSLFSPEASPASHSVTLDEDKERQTTALTGLLCLVENNVVILPQYATEIRQHLSKMQGKTETDSPTKRKTSQRRVLPSLFNNSSSGVESKKQGTETGERTRMGETTQERDFHQIRREVQMLWRDGASVPHNRPHQRRGERGTEKVPQPNMETRHQGRIPNGQVPNPLLQLQQRQTQTRTVPPPDETVNSSSLQGDSHVNRSHMQGDGKEQVTKDTSGQKCLQSSKTSNQTGSSLKTCVGLLLGTKAWFSKQCVLTWKAKVTKSNRLLFQLSPSVRPTGEIESGLLPTTRAGDGMSGQELTAKETETGWIITRKNGVQRGAKVGDVMGSGLGTGVKLRLHHVMGLWMMGYPETWLDLPLATPNTDENHLKR